MRVVVVGAWISGLGAAFALSEAGCEVRLLESAGRVGGRMVTDSEQGYTWDPGAQIMLPQYTKMHWLMRRLGLRFAQESGLSREAIVSHTSCLWRTRLASMRSVLCHPSLPVREKLLLSKVLLAAVVHRSRVDFRHPERAAGLPEESLRQWGDREIGPAAVDYLLSLSASGFFFWRPEETPWWTPLTFALLLPHWRVLTPRGGMGAVPEALAKRLDVSLNVAVERVEELPGGFVILRSRGPSGTADIEADRVVLATPAPITLGMLDRPEEVLGPERAAYLRAVSYTRTLSTAVAFRRAPERESMGVFVPTVLGSPLASVGWEHLKAPGRAPRGAGLGIFMPTDTYSSAHWHQGDDGIARGVLDAAEVFYPGIARQSCWHRIHRWEYATPRLGPRMADLMARARAARPRADAVIFTCGDYWKFPTTESALSSGLEAADEVLMSLRKK